MPDAVLPHYALLDHIPLGICVSSPSLRVRFWNLCLESWTGIPRQQILGTRLDERFPHLATDKYLGRLQGIFVGGPPAIFSSQLHPHLIPAPLDNDELRIFQSVVTAVPRDDGAFDALFSLQDFTEASRRIQAYRELRDQALQEIQERQKAEKDRRRLEAKIQHAQKLESLGVLAGGLAHDLNNLLVGILGNAELARQDLPPGSPITDRLEQVTDAGQRAAELSNQMLAYSGRGRFVARPLSLAKEVAETARMRKIELPTGVRLQTEAGSGAATIAADPAQIRQLLNNLITNAVDSLGGAPGRLSIKTLARLCDRDTFARCYLTDLPPGPYVCLEVTDTGCGMGPETLEKIFDPFFTTKFAGRGLGLAAVLGIVRGHRGTLRVESQPGRGTRVEVLFPASDEALIEEVTAAREAEPWRGKGKVLVIDDEAVVRRLAEATLTSAGLEASTAGDGPCGIALFSADPQSFDLVILDLTMPGMDGLEVYRELRYLRPEVKILLSSGYHEHQAARLFAEDPPSDFLKKPYQPSELLARVRQLLTVS